MDKVYQDLKDVYVSNYVVYDGGDNKAYADADKENQLTTSQLFDCFIKGCVIKSATGMFKPVSYAESSSIGSVTYVGSDGNVTIAAVADPEE